MLTLGKPAPLRAGPLDLRPYRGKNVLLLFYRGAWCPVCDLQLRGLREDYPKFQELNADIVALSNDPPAASRMAEQALRLPFPLVSDLEGVAARRFGAASGEGAEKSSRPLQTRGLWLEKWMDGLDRRAHAVVGLRDYFQPSVFILDRAGKVRYAHVGADPLDRPSNGELLRVLEGLRNGKKRNG